MADEPQDVPQPQGISEDELLDALGRLRVEELLVQTLVTVSSLGFARLEPERRDLAQARLAIEALRALLPVLEESGDEALVRDLHGARSSLQLAYARAVAEDGPDDADRA